MRILDREAPSINVVNTCFLEAGMSNHFSGSVRFQRIVLQSCSRPVELVETLC